MDYAPCSSRWYYTYLLIILHSPLASEVGFVVSPKLCSPLAYRGVLAANVQGGGLFDNSHMVAFVLPARATAVLLFASPRAKARYSSGLT